MLGVEESDIFSSANAQPAASAEPTGDHQSGFELFRLTHGSKVETRKGLIFG